MKCLVTKLQASINDDFLPFVGEGIIDGALFDWSKMPNGLKVSFQGRQGYNIRIAGDGVYALDSEESQYTEKDSVKDHLTTCNVQNPNGVKAAIFVKNKNDINRLYTNYDVDNKETFPISLFTQFPTIERIGILTASQVGAAIPVSGDLSYLSELSKLIDVNFGVLDSRHSDSVYGDISVFSDKVNMQNLNLTHTRVTGNISSLKKLTAIKFLNLSYTEVNGTVEDLCTGLQSNGKTSGTIDLRCMYSNITYQGEALGSNKTITFTSSGYTVS